MSKKYHDGNKIMNTRSISNGDFFTNGIDTKSYDEKRLLEIRKMVRRFSKCEITLSKELDRKRYMVQKAFEILAIYEEIADDQEGRMYNDMCMWLKHKYETEDDVFFKRILKNAWSQKYSFKSTYPLPHPDRPSFLLLNTEWMKKQGCDFIAQPLLYSIYPEVVACSDNIIEF